MNAARYEKSFKALQRINQVAADAIGADDFLSGVLDLMLDIFQCDRAWLLYPCDPVAPSWRVAMERTRPEWPGGLAMNVDFPMTPESATIYRAILDFPRVLKFDTDVALKIAEITQFAIKLQLIMAIRPRMDKPWAFGIHHCVQAHSYTEEETELFEEIGKRVAEALSHFAVMEQLRQSERYNRMLFDNSPIGLTLGRMDGSLIEVNPAFADIVGCSVEEAKELTAWQSSAEGHALQDRQRLECLSTTARFGPCEDEFSHRDGHRVPVQISSNLLEKDGEFYVLSCIEDITARKQSDEDLRVAAAVFESHDAIIITDTHANIIRVNKAYSDTTGYSAEEVMGKNPRMMSSGRYDKAFYAAMWQQLLHTGTWAGEIFDRHKNGQIYPKWLTITAVKNERQVTIRYVAIFSDITARIRVEDAKLQESEERFRGTLEQAAVGIVHATLDGVYLRVNEKFCTIVGYSHDELQHLSFRDITYSADLGRDIDYWQQMLAGEITTFAVEKRYVRKDKTLVWINLNISMLRNEAGTAKYFIGVVEDITRRKHAEDAVNKSERKYRTLVESSQDAIMTLTADDGFLSGNPAAVALFACRDEQEFITLSPAAVSPEFQPDGRRSDAEAQEMMQVAMDKGYHFFEWTHMRLDGAEFMADVLLTCMDVGSQKIIQATVRDITERKRAELQLRGLSAHIQSVREQEKASLAREIHDDLGGTLTALKMDAYWLTRDLNSEKELAPLLARVESMSALLDNAVAIARRVITDLRPTMLDDLGLLAALEWQAGQFQKRTGIECRIVCVGEGCGGGRCEVKLDKMQSINLFRIFQETLTNVARHSGASRVEVEFEKDKQWVALSISDNGAGLPPGHTIASSSYGIRGMHERAGQLGGKIDIDSPPGGGFRLKVTVPVSADNGENP